MTWKDATLMVLGWTVLVGTIVTATIASEQDKEVTMEIRVLKTELDEARKGCKETPDGQATLLNQKGQFFSVPCSVIQSIGDSTH